MQQLPKITKSALGIKQIVSKYLYQLDKDAKLLTRTEKRGKKPVQPEFSIPCIICISFMYVNVFLKMLHSHECDFCIFVN